MSIHDLYGFADTDIETGCGVVEQAFTKELVAAYRTYRGGDYYRSVIEDIEHIVLQHNFDVTEQE